MKEAQRWIEELELEPHPEGGYFRETFVSSDEIPTDHLGRNYSGPRKAYTLIYYLLKSGQVSKFHRLKSDEIWLYHAGSTLDIHVLDTDGNYEIKKLGPALENGESFQHIIKPGNWFGASVARENSYCLVSCFVSPGFDFADFEMAFADSLLQSYPQHREIISNLT